VRTLCIQFMQIGLIIVDWTQWTVQTADNFRGVYSDTTQLNSTDPVKQRTAKSVVFLFMTSRPTN